MESSLLPGSWGSRSQGAEEEAEWTRQMWGGAPFAPPRALTHTLPTLCGGLEASLAQTVEGALSVDTLPPETPVSDCTLVHI